MRKVHSPLFQDLSGLGHVSVGLAENLADIIKDLLMLRFLIDSVLKTFDSPSRKEFKRTCAYLSSCIGPCSFDLGSYVLALTEHLVQLIQSVRIILR